MINPPAGFHNNRTQNQANAHARSNTKMAEILEAGHRSKRSSMGDMQGLVSEAKRNRFSSMPKLSDDDVFNVWNTVSSFIERNMRCQKGVSIQGFGVFTFTQQKMDVGNLKYLLIQEPVFAMSEKFAMIHGLQIKKYHINGAVPVVPLNFSALAYEMGFTNDRDILESCVRELINSISRSVNQSRNVEFEFAGIGKLSIRHKKVRMRFYKEFLESLDGSGHLVNALENRPGTSDSSIISSDGTKRPPTRNTVVLPRIRPGEEEKLDGPGSQTGIITTSRSSTPATLASGKRSVLSTPKNHLSPIIEDALPEENIKEKVSSPLTAAPYRSPPWTTEQPSPPRTAQQPSPPRTAQFNRQSTAEPDPPRSAPKVTKRVDIFAAKGVEDRTRIKFITPEPTNKRTLTTPDVKLTPKVSIKNQNFASRCSGCHHQAGQELCYLCFQREARNAPVYFHEQRRLKEQEEDRLLQQYQTFKDTEAILKDHASRAAARERNQKDAAFNLGVAEAIKTKKNERPTEFHRSFVFHKRSVTPPFNLSQDQYHKELAEQVRTKAAALKKSKHEKDFLERLEQVQLAEDLAIQRQQYLKNKRLQSEEYRKSLDTQIYIKKCLERQQLQIDNDNPCRKILSVPKTSILLPFQQDDNFSRAREPRGRFTLRYRPLPLPATEPDSDSPVFGIHDATHEKMVEKRLQATKLHQDQLRAASQKKKKQILTDLKTQEEEKQMLKNAKRDLLEEILVRNHERVGRRKDLEATWFVASKAKHEKEAEEKRRAKEPGVLLQEQCDKYCRCGQCKRRPINNGESNIWCESRYVSGSRIMV